MAKSKLTAGRIASHACPEGKAQAFLWCADVQGLGVRATPNSSRKRFIFESKLNGRSLRMTIGETSIWNIADAQAEARKLQTLIDQGRDPRQLKADNLAANENAKKEQLLKASRDSVTVKDAWDTYLNARKTFWSKRHYTDHVVRMHQGGEVRKRSKKLTVAAPLALFANLKLSDLSSELILDWAKREGLLRPSSARLSLRLFKAFLSWCASHQTYKTIISKEILVVKEVRDYLGKAKPKNDALQREQLPAWYAAVTKIDNPVISAYFQTLLLIGCRPNEITALEWSDVDFQWNSITIRDKIEGQRVIPLTPYVSHLLSNLPRRNKFVFSSTASKSGHIMDVHRNHDKACAIAGIELTLHGYRRSFASLCEWIEMPAGISAQIQGHKPQGVREKNYIRRPLDLLRKWHVSIENWILDEAKSNFKPMQPSIRVVK